MCWVIIVDQLGVLVMMWDVRGCWVMIRPVVTISRGRWVIIGGEQGCWVKIGVGSV